MKIYRSLFGEIISLENLFRGWEEFRKGKRGKSDVQRFERHLEENIFNLHRDLVNKTYRHGPYRSFYIHDPKQRLIHKATVRDRVLHHAIFAKLNPIFEPTFISHSFSCRVGKGTHKGVEAAAKMLRQVSGNGTKPCFVLKGDIKKFFQSINHAKLIEILARKIKDHDALWLLREIVSTSTSRTPERERERDPALAGCRLAI
ncbi:hypothetical protein GTO10_06635 [Candidatus Saccharibacteria bacterium]|nr:hypothetical protein [Candidatus Saccharibacteria bacterium]